MRLRIKTCNDKSIRNVIIAHYTFIVGDFYDDKLLAGRYIDLNGVSSQVTIAGSLVTVRDVRHTVLLPAPASDAYERIWGPEHTVLCTGDTSVTQFIKAMVDTLVDADDEGSA